MLIGTTYGQKLNYPTLSVPLNKYDSYKAMHMGASRSAGKIDRTLNWALTNIGFFDMPMTKLYSCTAPVVVAIIDTGIDYNHDFLRGSLWINKKEVPLNNVDDDSNGYVDDVIGWDFVNNVSLPYDTHGHGTHVGGLIGAAGEAVSVGVSGVCPGVAIMPLKYYDNYGAGYNNLANTVRAIHYAVKNGAQIINYSGGGADPASGEKAAIEEANRKGVLFVAAAGNDGHNNDQAPYYPASYGLENIIGVASINRQNQLLPSSNFGKTVQVAAPGLMVLSTLPQSKFGTMSGTSQSTAIVSGIAALLYSKIDHLDNNTYLKVKRAIVSSSEITLNNKGVGIVNIPKALRELRKFK